MAKMSTLKAARGGSMTAKSHLAIIFGEGGHGISAHNSFGVFAMMLPSCGVPDHRPDLSKFRLWGNKV